MVVVVVKSQGDVRHRSCHSGKYEVHGPLGCEAVANRQQCARGTGYVHLLSGRDRQQVPLECSSLFNKTHGVTFQHTLICNHKFVGHTLGICVS